jgi:hypothetical protein
MPPFLPVRVFAAPLQYLPQDGADVSQDTVVPESASQKEGGFVESFTLTEEDQYVFFNEFADQNVHPGTILEAQIKLKYPELFVEATLENAVFLNRVSLDPKVVFTKMMKAIPNQTMLSEHEDDLNKEKCLGVYRLLVDSMKHLKVLTVLERLRTFKRFFLKIIDVKTSWPSAMDKDQVKLLLEREGDDE